LTEQEKRPEAQQLLASLALYAASDGFRPVTEVPLARLRGLFR